MARTGTSNIVQAMEDGTFFMDNDTPTGLVNGSNTVFTLTFTPAPTDELKVFVNGSRLKVTEDFTLSGDTLTLNTAPPTTSIILADYRITPA